MIIKTLTLCILAYLIGGIPSGFLCVKVFHKKDIRKYGSGNIGFTNVLRTVGILTGIAVLVLDAGKAYAVSFFFPLFFDDSHLFRLIFGVLTIVGNVFNPFLHFKGGKGVGTGLGVALAISPFSVLFSLAVFLIVVKLSRYVSLASLSAATTFFLSCIIFYICAGKDPYSVVFAVLLFCIIVIRHSSNIKRLIRGEENKIGSGPK
jgi:glycerol-3-phosphate acyltransferase PlsY